MLRQLSFVLFAICMPFLMSAAQGGGAVGVGGGGGGCPNRNATTTAGPKLTCSKSGANCQNGEPCDYTCTYTPPATSCGDTEVRGKCCQNHQERAYTQNFWCAGTPQTCKGGPKNFFGSGVTVYTTADCDEKGKCPEFVPPAEVAGAK